MDEELNIGTIFKFESQEFEIIEINKDLLFIKNNDFNISDNHTIWKKKNLKTGKSEWFSNNSYVRKNLKVIKHETTKELNWLIYI